GLDPRGSPQLGGYRQLQNYCAEPQNLVLRGFCEVPLQRSSLMERSESRSNAPLICSPQAGKSAHEISRECRESDVASYWMDTGARRDGGSWPKEERREIRWPRMKRNFRLAKQFR